MIVGSGNFGIKNKKCLIVGNPALKSISGEFDNDNLEVISTGDITFLSLNRAKQIKWTRHFLFLSTSVHFVKWTSKKI